MRKTVLIAFQIILFYSQLFADGKELQMIKLNYKQMIQNNSEGILINVLSKLPKEELVSDQMVVELMDRYPYSTEYINTILNTIQANGSWADIDYNDKMRSGWLPKNHAQRILDLTKVYSKQNSPFFKSAEVAEAVHIAMDFWFKSKLVCPNWWYNQIGIPKTLGPAFILFEDQMSNEEIQSAIEVMNNSRFGMTGQNKVWLAGNVLVKALLQNNYALVMEARDIIFSEIVIGNKEGIKTDHSFHQHGAMQQFGNYGAAYVASMSFWGKVFNETSLAIHQEQLNIISNLINMGYSQILWKGYMDVNALGRQFFRQAQRHKAFSVGFSANAMADIDKENRLLYQSLLCSNFFHDTCFSYLQPAFNTYHFWQSDQTVHRPDNKWMASVKMSSSRVIGAEAGNGDNKLGFYLADGATYTYVDGDEYNNIFAVWDWRKIPGVTSYQTLQPLKQLNWGAHQNNSSFAGNVNNGKTGITAMHFKREGIDARKAWIFTNDYVLCLGAGITADSGCVITTAIEQCLSKKPMQYWNGKAWESLSVKEWSNGNNPRFFHNKTGYIILSGKGKATLKEQTGNWHNVMQMYPNAEAQADKKTVFSLWVDHGIDPKNESYQYLILPASTPATVAQLDEKNIKITKNDKTAQVVELSKEGTSYIAAYQPLQVNLFDNIHFQCFDTGLFMVKQVGNNFIVTLSDPTQLLDKISFILNGVTKIIRLPDGEEKGTPISVEL